MGSRLPEVNGARFVVWNLHSANGRPFGEANASDRAREGVEMDMRVCKYAGSRHGKLMNVSALPEITASWKSILAHTGFLRELVMEREGISEMTHFGLTQMGALATAIPAYFVRKGWDSRKIPDEMSALFKAGQGLIITPSLRLMEVSLDDPFDAPIDVDLFMDATEELGGFLRKDRACAGPPHMIRAFVQAAIEGAPYTRAELWPPLLEDLEPFLKYTDFVRTLVLTPYLLEEYHREAVRRVAARAEQEPTWPEWSRGLRPERTLKQHSVEVWRTRFPGLLPEPTPLSADALAPARALLAPSSPGETEAIDFLLEQWAWVLAAEDTALAQSAAASDAMHDLFKLDHIPIDTEIWDEPWPFHELVRKATGLESFATPTTRAFRRAQPSPAGGEAS